MNQGKDDPAGAEILSGDSAAVEFQELTLVDMDGSHSEGASVTTSPGGPIHRGLDLVQVGWEMG